MKLTASLLTAAATAALCISTISAHGAPPRETAVSIDLGGVTFKSGINQARNSLPNAIVAVKQYDYSISGTCHGTGLFALDVPPGTTLAEAMDKIQPGASSFLNGTVFSLTGRLPLTVLNRSVIGSHSVFGYRVAAAATIRTGITRTGVAGLSLTGMRFAINGKPDMRDTIVIDPASTCQISVTTPPSLTPQPDALLLLSANAAIGNNIYNTDGTDQTQIATVTRGATKTFLVLITNDGQTSDTYTVSGNASTPGFAVRYFVGRTNVTAAVTAGTYSFPDIASGDLRLLRVVVTAGAGAAHGSSKDVLVTTTSTTDNAKDAVKATLRVR